MIACPICNEKSVVFKEKYPNAVLSFLKEEFAQCTSCKATFTKKELIKK